jgi:hypothetical protein
MPLLVGAVWLGACGSPSVARDAEATRPDVVTATPAELTPALPMTPMSVQTQGMSLQGMSLQGVQLQGQNLQGRNLQGISLAGFSVQGTTIAGLKVGDSLTGNFADGGTTQLVIGDIETDTRDPSGEITLYTVLYRNPDTGALENACPADPYGEHKAIAVAGTWDAKGARVASTTQFTLGCTSGVIAKCVRWGYKPWKSVNGKSLADYHQACTRMARADYCGDGSSHTIDGTWIDVFDNLGIQQKTPGVKGMLSEASWSPAGAVCVTKPRWYGMALVRPGTGLSPTLCENSVDSLSLGKVEMKEDVTCDLKPQTGTVLVQNTSFVNLVNP